jgi:hypothetical protein
LVLDSLPVIRESLQRPSFCRYRVARAGCGLFMLRAATMHYPMKYLIVGLGNVGTEYALTRHNMGFMVLDQLAKRQAAIFQPDRLASLATCQYRGRTLYLIKPATYMNHSGRAVGYWLGNLKLPVEQCLVIVDDVALPFGRLRMRPQGATAGHKPTWVLKSIQGFAWALAMIFSKDARPITSLLLSRKKN